MKSSGERPEEPSDRGDRARGRRMRQVLWLSATTLALVFILRGGAFRSSLLPSGLTVSRARGDAWAERGPWIFRSADAVVDGSRIVRGALVTTDTHAKVALTDPFGCSIRLDGGTALRVDLSDRLVLTRGAVYVDTGAGHAELRIETPFGTIEELGTQFQARLDGSRLVVRVREGAVTLRGRTRPVRAAAGQAIIADGRKVAVAADPAPAGWDWIEGAAPMMALDGRSLANFVAWAARERGAIVRWTDPEVEARARTIALRGSIDGLSLDRATESVTAMAGVPCRWGKGELVVGN